MPLARTRLAGTWPGVRGGGSNASGSDTLEHQEAAKDEMPAILPGRLRSLLNGLDKARGAKMEAQRITTTYE